MSIKNKCLYRIEGSTEMRSVMKKPLIGITVSQDSQEPMYLLKKAYVESIILAGGIPVLIPHADGIEIEGLLNDLDGILFSGGSDVYPKLFGEECLDGFEMSLIIPDRDKFEIALYHSAIKKDIPMLGICRGIQLMAIAGGGTIYQDIDSCMVRTPRIRHTQKAPDWFPTHSVYFQPNSFLHGIYHTDKFIVNSFHHQAVKNIPIGYISSAVSPDGVIEAIELPEKKFVVGVQWHPERTVKKEKESLALFQAFIKAAMN